jgi:hypothetical protein
MGLTFNNGRNAAAITSNSSLNVAIGTSTPSNTYQGLTIYGSNPSLSLQTSGAGGWTWTEYRNSAGTNNFSMGVNQSIPQFVIKAGAGLDSPNFVMTSAGNVGIGTSSPSANLQLSGFTSGLPATSGSAQRGAYRIANSSNIGFDFGTVAAGQAWIQVSDVGNYASNFPLLLNPNGGNVGIGTTSPAYTLDVNGTGKFTSALINSGAGNNYINFVQNSTNIGYVGDANWLFGGSISDFGIRATNNLVFGIGASERMRITSGGLFFVNTTTSGGFGSGHRIYRNVAQGDFFLSVDNGVEFSSLFMGVNGSGYSAGLAGQWVGRNTSTGRSINAGGTINASGADYAEYMTKAIVDTIEKGDIVGVDKNGLLTNVFEDAKSFVVKSTDPSYVGGDTWGNIDIVGKKIIDGTDKEKELLNIKLEEARAKVDRIAFSGQVPCNVYNAKVGDYIVPIELNGKISGQAITNPTFEQYKFSVGKVWKIMDDGRAWIAVKIG